MFRCSCEGPLVTEAESHSTYAALERHLQHFCFSLERGKHVTHGHSHTKEGKSSRLNLINKTVAPSVGDRRRHSGVFTDVFRSLCTITTRWAGSHLHINYFKPRVQQKLQALLLRDNEAKHKVCAKNM